MSRKLFFCGRLFRPQTEADKTCLLVENGTILDLLTRQQAAAVEDAEKIDFSDSLVGPGLVDIHCHGADHGDFSDEDVEDTERAAAWHLREGTTTLLATVGSCSESEILSICTSFRRLHGTICPNLAGLHLEGPYFSPNRCGAHPRDCLRDPHPREWRKLESFLDILKIMTLAPERPGALDLIRAFAPSGTVFSIGHSEATYTEIQNAMEMGVTHSAHIFNAMSRAARRNLVLEPGVLETILLLEGITAELIGDGIHVSPRLCEFVHQNKGTRGIALISDAMRGAGCLPGDYAFIHQSGLRCRLMDKPRVSVLTENPNVLASSASSLRENIRTLYRTTSISLANLWTMASETPARILGIDHRKGRLAPGCDADFIALDAELNVRTIVLRGKVKKEA